MKKDVSYKKIIKYYLSFAKKYWYWFLLSFIFYFLATVFKNVILPIYYKDIIDALSLDKTEKIFSSINHSITVVVAILIFAIFAYRIGEIGAIKGISPTLRDLHDFCFKTIHSKTYDFFVNNFSGSLVAKEKRFVNSFERMFDLFLFDFAAPISIITGSIIVLFGISKNLAFTMIGLVILYLAIIPPILKRKKVLDILKANADSKVTAGLADTISNFLTIKIFSGLNKEIKGFSNVTEGENLSRKKVWNFDAFMNLLLSIINFGSEAVFLVVSIYLWKEGLINAGSVVLVKLYVSTVTDRLWTLSKSISKFTNTLNDASEMVEIIDEKVEILDGKKHIPKSETFKIDFKDINFSYSQNSTLIFNNLTLSINSGEKIGLVGHSGSGKTTLTKLLLRFTDINSGSIEINGLNISKIIQDDLRNVISYVPQDSILFHRTLRENIAYGKPNATEIEVIDAAKQAHAHEFIESLPNGYDTLVGERGIKLSGGERQRVAIARAILKNAPILILDEATSSLDSVSEMHIKEALDLLMEGKTTIVIAHRLSTIEKMDRIIVLEKGEIVEEGKHRELLEKKGIYFNFWNHQTGGFIE